MIFSAIQEVRRQQIEGSCGVEQLSSGAAHFALCGRDSDSAACVSLRPAGLWDMPQ